MSFVDRTRQTEPRQPQNVSHTTPSQGPEPAAAAPGDDPWKAADPCAAQPAAGAPAASLDENCRKDDTMPRASGQYPDEAGRDRDQGGDRGWQEWEGGWQRRRWSGSDYGSGDGQRAEDGGDRRYTDAEWDDWRAANGIRR